MTKNGLSDIVSALTANEKRNFHLTNATHKDQNYYQVYKVLEKDPYASNHQVKAKVQNKAMNVPYEKAYLYKMLSRSLRNFYESQSIEATLQQNLLDIEILYTKGLLKPCMEVIKAAQVTAAQHEAFLTSTKLLHWELKSIVQTGDFIALSKFIQQKRAAEKELHAKQMDYEDAVFKKAHLVSFFMVHGLSKSSVNKQKIPVELRSIRKGFDSTLSFTAFLQYAEALIFYFNIIGEMKAGLLVSEKVIERYDKDPHLKYLFPLGYISNLGNYCQHIIFYERSEKVSARIYEYEMILKDKKLAVSEAVRQEIDVTLKVIKFDIHAQVGEYASTLPASLKILDGFPANVDEMRADLAISLCLMASASLIMNNLPAKALTVIDHCLIRFKEQTRQDLYFCLQALYLLAQYDIANHKILPSLIKSVSRYFKNKGLAIKAPYLLLSLLSELLKTPLKERDQLLADHYAQLVLLAKDNDEDLFLGSTKILAWIKGKRGLSLETE